MASEVKPGAPTYVVVAYVGVVEPPFVSAAENKVWLHNHPDPPRPNRFSLIERNVGYAARLLRPRALGTPVAMTFP
jgi:predicted Abi (CAAX) family protease